MNKNTLGERIKLLRTENNISQSFLAKELRTYQQNVAQWEKGIVKPNVDTIVLLAKFFDVTADYLLGLSDY